MHLHTEKEGVCEAVHLLPKSKGDEYIAIVLRDRLHLYNSEEPRDLGIESAENGIFLRSDLHLALRCKECAFLKTPNFALEPSDIPRVEEGHPAGSQYFLEPESGRNPTSQSDAYIDRLNKDMLSPLSNLILDFIYGVAVYHCWSHDGADIQRVLGDHFTSHFKVVLPPTPPLQPDSDTSSEPDDHSLSVPDAMDTVLAFSMLLKGVTPEMVAAKRRRQEEEEEVSAKEASRVRVEEWMQNSSLTGLVKESSGN